MTIYEEAVATMQEMDGEGRIQALRFLKILAKEFPCAPRLTLLRGGLWPNDLLGPLGQSDDRAPISIIHRPKVADKS